MRRVDRVRDLSKRQPISPTQSTARRSPQNFDERRTSPSANESQMSPYQQRVQLRCVDNQNAAPGKTNASIMGSIFVPLTEHSDASMLEDSDDEDELDADTLLLRTACPPRTTIAAFMGRRYLARFRRGIQTHRAKLALSSRPRSATPAGHATPSEARTKRRPHSAGVRNPYRRSLYPHSTDLTVPPDAAPPLVSAHQRPLSRAHSPSRRSPRRSVSPTPLESSPEASSGRPQSNPHRRNPRPHTADVTVTPVVSTPRVGRRRPHSAGVQNPYRRNPGSPSVVHTTTQDSSSPRAGRRRPHSAGAQNPHRRHPVSPSAVHTTTQDLSSPRAGLRRPHSAGVQNRRNLGSPSTVRTSTQDSSRARRPHSAGVQNPYRRNPNAPSAVHTTTHDASRAGQRRPHSAGTRTWPSTVAFEALQGSVPPQDSTHPRSRTRDRMQSHQKSFPSQSVPGTAVSPSAYVSTRATPQSTRLSPSTICSSPPLRTQWPQTPEPHSSTVVPFSSRRTATETSILRQGTPDFGTREIFPVVPEFAFGVAADRRSANCGKQIEEHNVPGMHNDQPRNNHDDNQATRRRWRIKDPYAYINFAVRFAPRAPPQQEPTNKNDRKSTLRKLAQKARTIREMHSAAFQRGYNSRTRSIWSKRDELRKALERQRELREAALEQRRQTAIRNLRTITSLPRKTERELEDIFDRHCVHHSPDRVVTRTEFCAILTDLICVNPALLTNEAMKRHFLNASGEHRLTDELTSSQFLRWYDDTRGISFPV